jgi:hypothetical protein
MVAVRGVLDRSPVQRQAPMRDYADQFEVSHGLNMLLVNAVFRWPLLARDDARTARVALILRAGAGPTIPRPEVIVLGAPGGAYEIGPVAVQGAAGVETKLWRGLYLVTEYKYTFTPTTFAIPNGNASFHVHSHHIVTGFALHF